MKIKMTFRVPSRRVMHEFRRGNMRPYEIRAPEGKYGNPRGSRFEGFRGARKPASGKYENYTFRESGDASSSSPRSELPSGHSREVRVNEGENTHILCTGR